MEKEEHKLYHRKILYAIITILLFLFGGATFYHYVEKWRYIDALYFSSATMTTVGYGDITPKTDAGKIFTILYVFSGVGIALYGLSLLATHFVEIRETFWQEQLRKLGGRIRKIKIKSNIGYLKKIKNLISYKPERLTKDYGVDYKK